MLTFREIGHCGRLGNQMFQYATLLATARRRGLHYGVPRSPAHPDAYRHFALRDGFPNLSADDCQPPPCPPDVPRFQEVAWNHFHAELASVADGTDLVGNFQSELYFRDFRNILLTEFSARPETVREAQQFLDGVREKAGTPIVGVHIRRGDYLTSAAHHNLGLAYYGRALAIFPNCACVICSDDPVWCRAHFAESVTISPFTDKFIDLEVLRRCDHVVIANSSFSWWGAWLNTAPGKLVVMPRIWLTHQLAQRPTLPITYCDGWIVI